MENTKTKEITTIGLMIALISISSYISFPIPFTPIMITAQTIAINLAALILTPRGSAFSVISFILLGIIGLPIFSGGASGIGVIVSPSGGYLLGFIVSVYVISFLKKKSNDLKTFLFLTIVIGMPIIYLFGSVGIMVYTNKNFIETIKIAILPFLLGDIIKCVIASIIASKLKKVIK